MRSRGSGNRLAGGGSGGSAFTSRVSALLLAMFATMATIYVAGRLWQDAENRLHLVEEFERRNSQVKSSISADDTLKIISCREQQKKLAAVEMDLAAARQAVFVLKHSVKKEDNHSKKKLLAVIGTSQRSAALKKLEDEKAIVVRFVIGRSANSGDSLDREIDNENRRTNDFIVLDGQVEAIEEAPKKTKLFFINAVGNWNAEFYVKVNDDVFVNIDTSDMPQVKSMPFHKPWRSLLQLTGLFLEHMHMMMSVLDHGSLDLMQSTLMKGNFAAPHEDSQSIVLALFFTMNNSGAAPDQIAAVEVTKERNGIDKIVLRNPRGASARVRNLSLSSILLSSLAKNICFF
ncbi:hypothetical protein P3X46_030131 [Hevea brasiliensis]|uniref:Hexosyltransferase n=1 Tax=Hevea brasiliensis TaxID=3981 RepID=A0ABQ9KVU3_HEVBR|nr:hypothetical protein P3X46_030131 [Hevea brasiliensis]